jgi:hypothetical protein
MHRIFATGIFPFNPAVIPESAFLPSDPFDAPPPENENNNNLPAINESQDKVSVSTASNLDMSLTETSQK